MATAAVNPNVLEFEFNEQEHLYVVKATKRPAISVTQVLASVGFVSYEFVKQEVLEYKSSLGTAVHKATEILDEDPDALNWDTVAPEAVPYVLAWEKFKKEMKFVPKRIEYRNCVRVNGVPVGFQIDREGLLEGFPAIAEIKCTCAEEKSWRYQLGGYDACMRAAGLKPEGMPYWTRFGVRLTPEAKYKICGPYNSPHHIDVFRCSLVVAQEKINEKIGGE